MAVNILLKRSSTPSKRPDPALMLEGEVDLNFDAVTGGLFYKDSAGDVVKVGPCQVSADAPNVAPAGSPGNSVGEFWFNTVDSSLNVWDGTAWVETNVGSAVQGITGTLPITVDNTDPTNPVIGVDAATTSAPGVVQLNNTTSSTSTTEALTANQGYLLQQQIDALVITNNLTLAGTYNADTGVVDNVTPEGAGVGFVNGDPLPAPDAANAGYFVIVDVQGSDGPAGTPPYHIGDWFLSDGTAYLFLNVGFQAAYATTSAPGIVQLATDAEVQAGTDTEHAVVPSSLQSKISDSTSTTSSTTIASSTAVKEAYDAAIAATLWTETAGVLSPVNDNTVVTVDVPMGIDGVTVTDSALSVSTLISPAQAIFLDNIQSVTVNGSDSLITHVVDSTTGVTPGILAVDEVANPAPYNLQIGELQLNGDAGSSGYILQSNGPGLAPTWVDNSTGDVTSVSGTAPITVDNTDPQNPIIGVEAASTSQAGVVQLYDDVDSTSTTEAATANAVKIAYDAATAASAAGLPTAGGTMTGNITFSAGTTIEYADVTAGTVVAADQLAVVVDATNGLLTVVTDFDAGFYTTSGDGDGGGVSVEVG